MDYGNFSFSFVFQLQTGFVIYFFPPHPLNLVSFLRFSKLFQTILWSENCNSEWEKRTALRLDFSEIVFWLKTRPKDIFHYRHSLLLFHQKDTSIFEHLQFIKMTERNIGRLFVCSVFVLFPHFHPWIFHFNGSPSMAKPFTLFLILIFMWKRNGSKQNWFIFLIICNVNCNE